MIIKLRPYLLLFAAIVWSFSFQSCTPSDSSDSGDGETSTDTEDVTKVNESPGSSSEEKEEMSIEEQVKFAAAHQKDLQYVYAKTAEISEEHVHKKDHYEIECSDGTVVLERHYNDAEQVHLMTYKKCVGEDCSTMHHYFWDNELIYQYHHHETTENGKRMIDDHKTYFKDGKIVRCLEKRYSYVKGENNQEESTYEQVDCTAVDKITKDMKKMLTSSEEDIKSHFCK